ncbi:MAG: helix-turn-helix transcriptional regulator [Pseudomonadota bacterium]
MLTIEQIRAARALLDWSQSDLAERAGLSQTGIARIENGTNKPNSKTLAKIQTAFDGADVEFIDTTGVKKRSGQVKTLRGIEGFRAFMDDVYEVASAGPTDICLFNGIPEVFYKWLGKDWYHDVHAPRMDKVKENFSFKIIISESEKEFMASSFAEYRWFPTDLSSDKTIYAYGDRLAFFYFDDSELTIRVLNQKDFADSFRVLFDIAWKNVAVKP